MEKSHILPLMVLTKWKGAGKMIKVEAIVREEKLEDVKEALQKIDVHGITMYQVMGCGTQKGYKEMVRGQEVDINMLPKIKFEIVVSSPNGNKKQLQLFVLQHLLEIREMERSLVTI